MVGAFWYEVPHYSHRLVTYFPSCSPVVPCQSSVSSPFPHGQHLVRVFSSAPVLVCLPVIEPLPLRYHDGTTNQSSTIQMSTIESTDVKLESGENGSGNLPKEASKQDKPRGIERTSKHQHACTAPESVDHEQGEHEGGTQVGRKGKFSHLLLRPRNPRLRDSIARYSGRGHAEHLLWKRRPQCALLD